jgi:hypothetical protein
MIAMHSFEPRPCRHEEAGRPHRTRKALVRCVIRNGSPGFDVTPVEPLPDLLDIPDLPERPFPDDETDEDE